MSDYSETRLTKKLGISDGAHVGLSGAPDGFVSLLQPLPAGVVMTGGARRRLDVAVLFATRRSELERRFPALARAIAPNGGLWVAWPKKAAAVPTELRFESVQSFGLAAGLVDNKSCSIDGTWQALRFVHRLKDRRTG